jgi:hypothetical protein
MKKMVILVVCMLFFTALPLTIGMTIGPKPTDDTSTDIGSTFVRGIITKPRLINLGNDITFRAIFVHYRTHGLGENQKGVLRGFQKITLANNFNGIMNDHFVFAKFDGTMKL